MIISGCKPEVKNEVISKITSDKAENTHIPPEFQGGYKAFYRHVHKSVMVAKTEEPGDYSLHMKFVIEKDGSFSNIEAIRNSTPDSLGLVEKATDAIKNYPRCKPAEINGKPVKEDYILPLYISH